MCLSKLINATRHNIHFAACFRLFKICALVHRFHRSKYKSLAKSCSTAVKSTSMHPRTSQQFARLCQHVANFAEMLLTVAEFCQLLTKFLQNFARMQSRPWRVITAYHFQNPDATRRIRDASGTHPESVSVPPSRLHLANDELLLAHAAPLGLSLSRSPRPPPVS